MMDDTALVFSSISSYVWCILLFTFSRAETPCPKNFTGVHVFDEAKHWQWQDAYLVHCDGRWALMARFKGVGGA